jgi:hypothetical protein
MQDEQVLVARYDALAAAGESCRQNPVIIGVAARRRIKCRRLHELHPLPEQHHQRCRGWSTELQLSRQLLVKLAQENVGGDEDVRSGTVLEKVIALSTCGVSGDENVRTRTILTRCARRYPRP